MAATISDTERRARVHRLLTEANEHLVALGYPAQFVCLNTADQSDPLNQKLLIGLRTWSPTPG